MVPSDGGGHCGSFTCWVVCRTADERRRVDKTWSRVQWPSSGKAQKCNMAMSRGLKRGREVMDRGEDARRRRALSCPRYDGAHYVLTSSSDSRQYSCAWQDPPEATARRTLDPSVQYAPVQSRCGRSMGAIEDATWSCSSAPGNHASWRRSLS